MTRKITGMAFSCAGLSALAFAGAACAEEPEPTTMPTIVVTATRFEQPAFDAAASVNVVDIDHIQEGQAEANLSEPLARVPGIFALNRQNYAQDLLISSRGFGANSVFGARGIKIFVDGIPATLADGQGQISHIDLASAARIEVLRGPFSVLYGNSAGGVINVFTENGKPGTDVTPYFESGSYGLHKYGLKLSGEQDGINYLVDAGRLESQGFRQHSATDRDNQNAKLKLRLGEGTTLQLVANRVSLSAEDPLGLTAVQVQQNRSQAGNFANAYDTRKTVVQSQGGLELTQTIDADNSLVLSPYVGARHTVQFLAGTSVTGVPAATNGVIDLSRNYLGIDVKWLHHGEFLGKPLRLATGAESNRNDDHRRTYNNRAGIQQAALATNQDLNQSAANLDGYAQVELSVTERTTLTGGVRQSQTRLSSTTNNGGTGVGAHTYADTTAMASLQYAWRADTHAYVSWGSGFDTPTLNQTVYSPDFLTGKTAINVGNFGLQAAVTHQIEVGIKSEPNQWAQWQAAVFDADTRNDIVVSAASSGRTAFANAPETSRKGIEFSAELALPLQFQAEIAYTLLNARVDKSYISHAGAAPVVVNANRRIPGVPGRGLFTELSWRQPDNSLEFALEGRQVGDMAADDTNTALSNGYAILNARAVIRQQAGTCSLTEFIRIDNLFDKVYVGSVIVNQAANQFYEPAPGRNWLIGAKADFHF